MANKKSKQKNGKNTTELEEVQKRGGGDTAATSNPQEARKLSIQRCIQSLVHACQCRDANCRLPSCHKMKRVVSHTKQCKRKTNGGCPICKQLIALCCYHAKLCQEAKCPVPFCLNIKQKLRQQQLQQRLQEAAMMRRRMAQMNARMNPGMQMNGPNNTGSKPMPPAQQQQQQPPINSIKPNGPLSHGGKPGQGGGQPNQNVLDAVKKVQEEAQRQSQPPGPLMAGNQRMPISSPVAATALSTSSNGYHAGTPQGAGTMATSSSGYNAGIPYQLVLPLYDGHLQDAGYSAPDDSRMFGNSLFFEDTFDFSSLPDSSATF